MANRIFFSESFDPTVNLALEEHLMRSLPADEIQLFLWQNQNTVVIGRNQNPWKECDPTGLAEQGVTLVRRMSGGGAVFHDLGNLCFTFLLSRARFDLREELSCVLDAVRRVGIDAVFSGRNDLLADGRKFSGTAYYLSENKVLLHGTLLVDVDFGRMAETLSPSRAKLDAKGIESVRSRVVNLLDLAPDLTIGRLQEALKAAFADRWGAVTGEPTRLDPAELPVDHLVEKYRSWEWTIGETPAFNLEQAKRFGWGEVQFCADLRDGHIKRIRLHTDAMETGPFPHLEAALHGQPFQPAHLARQIAGVAAARPEERQILADLREWVATF